MSDYKEVDARGLMLFTGLFTPECFTVFENARAILQASSCGSVTRSKPSVLRTLPGVRSRANALVLQSRSQQRIVDSFILSRCMRSLSGWFSSSQT